MNTEFSTFLDTVLPQIESTLDTLLPAERISPSRLHQAMRYSTLAGGKRIRPCLCVAAFATYQQDWRPVFRVASAVELIHSYSLIHDDLPAMDDDDFRRGRKSCHKEFDEATAILAGDALLTLAFEVLGNSRDFTSDRMLHVISMLSQGAGSVNGMIAGQVLDLEAENREVDRAGLEKIHRAKTGALIGAAVRIGAYLGGASASDSSSIDTYCDRIGLAFQVIDDILDAAGGIDNDEGKATYVTLYGLEKSRAIAQKLMAEARESLCGFGARGRLLLSFCDYLETRTY